MKRSLSGGKNGYEEEIRTSPLPENAVLVTGLVANNNTKEFVEKQYAGKGFHDYT